MNDATWRVLDSENHGHPAGRNAYLRWEPQAVKHRVLTMQTVYACKRQTVTSADKNLVAAEGGSVLAGARAVLDSWNIRKGFLEKKLKEICCIWPGGNVRLDEPDEEWFPQVP